MRKIRAYNREQDKKRLIHFRIWTDNPNDGESACGLLWLRTNPPHFKPRYSSHREDVNCPDCLTETVLNESY